MKADGQAPVNGVLSSWKQKNAERNSCNTTKTKAPVQLWVVVGPCPRCIAGQGPKGPSTCSLGQGVTSAGWGPAEGDELWDRDTKQEDT